MNRRTTMALLLAVAMGGASEAALAKDTIKFATQSDPIFIAAVWPITSGKIKSDAVDIEFSFLSIDGLNQAPATRQYDVFHTTSLSVPRGVDQGMNMSVIATSLRYPKTGDGANIWVNENSPYKTLSDLKGKTIGTYGLNSGGFTNVREVLAEKYGFNVSLENGDFRFVELPAPALPAALQSGRIDAATLVHAQIFKAKQSGGFRSLVKVQDDLNALFGAQIPSLVLAAYNERLAAKPEAYKAFLELLRASIAYVHANEDEVFKAVGQAQKIDPAYFKMWFTEFGEIPYDITPTDIEMLGKSWQSAKAIGVLTKFPDPAKVVWRYGDHK